MRESMPGQIKEKSEIGKAYGEDGCARRYIEERFSVPLGRVMHERQLGLLNETIRKHGVKSALELACGPGRLTADVQGLRSGTATDLNDAMLAEAARRLGKVGRRDNWILVRADAFHIDLNRTFDLVYTFRFIRHFERYDRERIYERVKHHLNPGGLFLLDVVNREVSYPAMIRDGLDQYPFYDELYAEQDFRAEMSSNGFRVLALAPVHPWYEVQRAIQIYLAPRNDRWAYRLLSLIERHFGQRPLEWVATCRRE